MHAIQKNKWIIWLLLCFWFSTGCSTTRTVPEGDRLYLGAEVTWEEKKPGRHKELGEALVALSRPSPNRKFLGMPVRLWLYNLGNKPTGKGLNHLLRNKWGEAPVLLSKAKPSYSADVLTSHMEDLGFLQASTGYETKPIGKKKAKIEYAVTAGTRYRIREVKMELDSSRLGKQIQRSTDNSRLIPGRFYNLEQIKNERERIGNYVRQRGFYYFNPDHLLVEVDSNYNGEVVLYVRLKDSIPANVKSAYRMGSITLFPTYNLSEDSLVRNKEAEDLGPYRVKDIHNLFLPKIFSRYVLLKEDSLYRFRAHERTLERLMSLGTYKFVKTEMEVADSNRLNARFFMTPTPRRSLQVELNGNSKSNNFVGSQITITSLNRNWLKRANRLEVKLAGGFEWQVGGNRVDQANTRGYSLTGEVAFNLPGIIVPFWKIQTSNAFIPRTRLSAGYELLSRPGLYNLNSFTIQQAYQWKTGLLTDHLLVPVSISYVLPSRISPEFQEILDNDPALRQSIDKQFIIGSNYTITYNNVNKKRIHSLFLQGNLDVAGNLLGLIIPANSQGQKNIGYQPFAQYSRVTGEIRHYWKLGKESQWVNRLLAGAGFSYGNNTTLPFVKQYMTGGSNSLRAFRARTLGPGSYRSETSTFAASEAGDIKLEFNTEWRFKLFSVLKGAIFADAGNIWLQRENPEKPGAAWSGSRFMKDVAVGAGVGLRIDASILVIRADLAIPLRKPWLPDGEKWVLNQVELGNPAWRRENMILNIAIGYPF
ncbi:translocation and assembly module lipoprotein TamL [Flavihumibacter cheonanensis]|uniref:translocation and assembly module lipoprotein TamL n=1 Tax=Flavihumibacter cheonanensis TaxID=1442385 RepID=UPI001EF844D4|nr:BamA/TamA family outer membrane protein [Flavihumibacter cheonanensis]MCG7752547.1 BamA/TamA family outer membrane protein [Flavihumibacter cheonanensis]